MYHLEIRSAHPNVLTAGSPGRVKKMAAYLDQPQIIESDRGLVTVHGTYKDMPVTAFSTGMGPASVSITMPEVIEACDADRMIFVRLGTSGGLKRYLNVGDFVVTTDVDRAETTSDKIMGHGYEAVATPSVRMALQGQAGRHKLSSQQVYAGRTRTTDDIYFDALQSKKGVHPDVVAVSMEFSAICALRDRYNKDDNRKIAAGELLIVSDVVVAEGHIDMTEFLKKKAQIEEAQIKIGLETLLEMQKF